MIIHKKILMSRIVDNKGVCSTYIPKCANKRDPKKSDMNFHWSKVNCGDCLKIKKDSNTFSILKWVRNEESK